MPLVKIMPQTGKRTTKSIKSFVRSDKTVKINVNIFMPSYMNIFI